MEILTLNNISVALQDKTILNNFSLQIFEGDFVLCKGKNGSGKTTLAKVMTNEIEYNGLMSLNGNVVNKQTELFPSIAYINSFTEKNFCFHNVIDELMFPLVQNEMNKKKAKVIALNIAKLFNIEHMLKTDIYSLSGGEKQIVALCSAIINNPKILICDEALSNLDENIKIKIFNTLKNYLRENNIALFFITNENVYDNFFDKVVNLSSKQNFVPISIYNLSETKLLELIDFAPKLNKKNVLNKTNITLNVGDTLACFGDIGSGKSLLLNSIAGFNKFNGEMKLHNINHNDIKIIFQNAENFLLKETPKLELEQFKNVDSFDDLIRETTVINFLEQETQTLSTAEKRLVSLCAVLLTKPKLLLVDEIFSNLSDNTKTIVNQVLKKYTKGGGTLIIVEHDTNLAKTIANKFIKIEKPVYLEYINKNVSLGKYINKNSLIHKIPAFIKIVFTIAFIVFAFLCNKPWQFGTMFLIFALVLVLSYINPLTLLKTTIPLWIFSIFVFLLNYLTIDIYFALKILCRLSLINLFVPMLTLTTSPFELLNAVNVKFIPFNCFKNVYKNLSLICVLALTQVSTSSIVAKNATRWQTNLGISYKGQKLKTKAKNLSEIFLLLLKYLVSDSITKANTLYLKGANYKKD